MEKYSIAPLGASEAKVSVTKDHYSNADCTGQVVASESPVSISISNYENIGVKSTTFYFEDGSINLPLVKSKFSIAETSVSLTGSGVFKNSENQTCIRLNSSKHICPDIIYPSFTPEYSLDLNIAVADGVHAGKSGKFFYIVGSFGSAYQVFEYFLAM